MDAINKWLDGRKTLIGGIGLLLVAVGTYFSAGLAAHGFNIGDLLTCVKAASVAMVSLGFGGKLQKLIDAAASLNSKS